MMILEIANNFQMSLLRETGVGASSVELPREAYEKMVMEVEQLRSYFGYGQAVPMDELKVKSYGGELMITNRDYVDRSKNDE